MKTLSYLLTFFTFLTINTMLAKDGVSDSTQPFKGEYVIKFKTFPIISNNSIAYLTSTNRLLSELGIERIDYAFSYLQGSPLQMAYELERICFELYSVQGQRIWRIEPVNYGSQYQTLQRNIDDLPAGNYLLKVTNGDQFSVEKVIVR